MLSDDTEIGYALACFKTGMVLASLREPIAPTCGEAIVPAAHNEAIVPASLCEVAQGLRIHDLTVAPRAPSAHRVPSDVGALLQHVGSNLHSDPFQQLVFMSTSMVHVVQRLRRLPDLAVVAFCADRRKLGRMLFGLRALLLEFEFKQERAAS